MYRQYSHEFSVYCPLWPCERKCGRFHENYLNTTRLSNLDNVPEIQKRKQMSVEQQENGKTNDPLDDDERDFHALTQPTAACLDAEWDPSSKPSTSKRSVFEQIMDRAARKVSASYVDAPMPPLPIELKVIAERRKSSYRRSPGLREDTTTISFDKPVWDDAELRRELLDSDEEHYLHGDPPSFIEDNESVLDEIIKTTRQDYFSNPTEHTHQDETILSSDDEYDYGNVDLSLKRDDSIDSAPILRNPRIELMGAPFEESLDRS